jgi:hypothetical protein
VTDRQIDAVLAAVRERPHTFTLKLEIASWGARAFYRAGGAGGTKPTETVLSSRSTDVLREVEDAFKEATDAA